MQDHKRQSALINDFCNVLMSTVEDYMTQLPVDQRWPELPLQAITSLAANTIMSMNKTDALQLTEQFCHLVKHLVEVAIRGEVLPVPYQKENKKLN